MEKIDFIVKQPNPPIKTNVLWLDTTTKELKSFNNGEWKPLTSGGGKNTDNVVTVTYDELVSLVKEKALTVGTYYKIKDYKTIVGGPLVEEIELTSIETPFTIIVKAIDIDKLDSNAKALPYQVSEDSPIIGFNLNAMGMNILFTRNPIADEIFNNTKYYAYYPFDLGIPITFYLIHDCKDIKITDSLYLKDEETEEIVEAPEEVAPSIESIVREGESLSLSIQDYKAWDIKYNIFNDYSIGDWVSCNSIKIRGNTFFRANRYDADNKYAWIYYYGVPAEGDAINYTRIAYTNTENPLVSDTASVSGQSLTIDEVNYPEKLSKGIIYYMKDEFNNETFYDFKSIKFKCTFNVRGQSINISAFTFTILIDDSLILDGSTLNFAEGYYIAMFQNCHIGNNYRVSSTSNLSSYSPGLRFPKIVIVSDKAVENVNIGTNCTNINLLVISTDNKYNNCIKNVTIGNQCSYIYSQSDNINIANNCYNWDIKPMFKCMHTYILGDVPNRYDKLTLTHWSDFPNQVYQHVYGGVDGVIDVTPQPLAD